jgi:hypothetical protein
MGNTCASFHALWPGDVADAAKAISRAYTKLGYERQKKAPAEGGKRVILLARSGERYVSIYDSTNADLDSGELKDVALAASKFLKTGTVFTSLYDSDSYEFVVFSNGRQVARRTMGQNIRKPADGAADRACRRPAHRIRGRYDRRVIRTDRAR